jgi:hypothetical protein
MQNIISTKRLPDINLDNFLTTTQRQAGMHLERGDLLTVTLILRGVPLANWGEGATIREIQEEANSWLSQPDAFDDLIEKGAINFGGCTRGN